MKITAPDRPRPFTVTGPLTRIMAQAFGNTGQPGLAPLGYLFKLGDYELPFSTGEQSRRCILLNSATYLRPYFHQKVRRSCLLKLGPAGNLNASHRHKDVGTGGPPARER